MEMELQKKLLKPKEITVEDKVENVTNTYIISKIPAFEAVAIFDQEIPALAVNMLKINELHRERIKELTLNMMQYVAVKTEKGEYITLSTAALIDNHCPSFETINEIFKQMLVYNTSFFKDGKSLNFLKRLEALATEKITEILVQLSDKLSTKK